ncbi:hypothetical protein AX23_00915 [Brucella melitensis 548]|nr:hypothetical protein AX23_00915 [Brucella melitensis 548]
MAKRGGAVAQIHHAMHRNDARKLMADLVQHMRRAARNDGDARKVALMFGFRHRQALDIIATAGKQADDAGKNARLIIDEDCKRVGFGRLGFGSNEIGRSGS